MNTNFFLILCKRFGKAFVAGGLASLTVQLSQGANLKDLKTFGVTLGVAFISGGLMAVEKLLQGDTTN